MTTSKPRSFEAKEMRDCYIISSRFPKQYGAQRSIRIGIRFDAQPDEVLEQLKHYCKALEGAIQCPTKLF